jgi:hypothetical protein
MDVAAALESTSHRGELGGDQNRCGYGLGEHESLGRAGRRPK